jgi:hypothetical protein
MGDPKHAASRIAIEFKEQRKQWFRALLVRAGVKDPDALALQLQILVDGAIATALVRNDPRSPARQRARRRYAAARRGAGPTSAARGRSARR